jgi:hypothetical protein
MAIGAALLAGPAFASTDSTALADSILDQAKAVSGGAAWDRLQGWHERGVIERGDDQIDYEVWLDLHKPGMVSQIVAPGRWQTRGFDGRVAWLIDPSYGAIADPAANAIAEARRNDYFGLYGFFFPGRFHAKRDYVGPRAARDKIYDVVRVTPDGAAAMDLWIDRQTHQLTAVVDPDKAHPLIAYLKDFKPVEGVLLPFTILQSTDGSKTVSVRRVDAYDFARVDPKRFVSPTR